MRFIQKHKAHLIFGYAFLLFVHFIIKDHLYPISILFYAFPLILIICFGFAISFLFIKQKKYFFGILISVFVLTFFWLNNYYFNNKYLKTGNEKNLIFWNVAKKPGLPLGIIINNAKKHNPDIIALVEAKDIGTKDSLVLIESLPEYEIKILKGNMLVAVKGDINSVEFKNKDYGYKFNYVKAKINGTQKSILITDIYASPFTSKKTDIKIICDFAKNHSVDIIVGDFNTPFESVHFNQFKNNYSSFHSKSEGLTSTWPFGIPLLEIDQVWISKTYNPLYLEKEYTLYASDHALLIAKYEE